MTPSYNIIYNNNKYISNTQYIKKVCDEILIKEKQCQNNMKPLSLVSTFQHYNPTAVLSTNGQLLMGWQLIKIFHGDNLQSHFPGNEQQILWIILMILFQRENERCHISMTSTNKLALFVQPERFPMRNLKPLSRGCTRTTLNLLNTERASKTNPLNNNQKKSDTYKKDADHIFNREAAFEKLFGMWRREIPANIRDKFEYGTFDDNRFGQEFHRDTAHDYVMRLPVCNKVWFEGWAKDIQYWQRKAANMVQNRNDSYCEGFDKIQLWKFLKLSKWRSPVVSNENNEGKETRDTRTLIIKQPITPQQEQTAQIAWQRRMLEYGINTKPGEKL